MRLGLSVAVVKDVFGQQERHAVDRLQPQSLAQHYKSGASARLSLSDIKPEDLDVVCSILACTGFCYSPALKLTQHSANTTDRCEPS